MQSIRRHLILRGGVVGGARRRAFSVRHQHINGYHPPTAAAAVSYNASAPSAGSTGNNNATPSKLSGKGDEGDDVSSTESSKAESIRGEVLDLAAGLRIVRPGDKIDIPYELTITEAMQEFWQSAFHSQDRINTSR